ncbi:hypothetical protein LV82_00656 [Albidovulum inexpectatum]|uniref:Uncharacterized protein n=2 Tax=Albidovulum inexpectatum TaxID=196587 RepID=A0A2S5JMH7_9RHOB|nr:hypothetical protein LV82_00656 [Albidovulum inexpectatum]
MNSSEAMSRFAGPGGFSRSNGPEPSRAATKDDPMKLHDQALTGELVRIPGLFRRWELPEVLKSHRTYRIEKAGAHQDGTPLVAIYVNAPDPAGTPAGTDA